MTKKPIGYVVLWREGNDIGIEFPRALHAPNEEHIYRLPTYAEAVEYAKEANRAGPAERYEVFAVGLLCADALSALNYIRERYGKLDGVGWDRIKALVEVPSHGW